MQKNMNRLAIMVVVITFLTMPFCAAAQPDMSAASTFFRDVPRDAWYYDDVSLVVSNGIMKGKTADTFDPNGKITHAELAQVLHNFHMMDGSAEYPGFGDVDVNAWYFPVVKSYGVFFPTHWNRYTGQAWFLPDEPITRDELAYTLLRSSGLSEDEIVDSYYTLTGDTDRYGVQYNPVLALRVMIELGLISGNGKGEYFEYEDVTRAQCAAILNRIALMLGNDTSTSLPDGLNTTPISVDNLLGSWEDSATGCSVEIKTLASGKYEINVFWHSGPSAFFSWELEGQYDEASRSISYTGICTESHNEGGRRESSTVYTDGTGKFTLDSMGRLIWQDDKDDTGSQFNFTKK